MGSESQRNQAVTRTASAQLRGKSRQRDGGDSSCSQKVTTDTDRRARMKRLETPSVQGSSRDHAGTTDRGTLKSGGETERKQDASRVTRHVPQRVYQLQSRTSRHGGHVRGDPMVPSDHTPTVQHARQETSFLCVLAKRV